MYFRHYFSIAPMPFMPSSEKQGRELVENVKINCHLIIKHFIELTCINLCNQFLVVSIYEYIHACACGLHAILFTITLIYGGLSQYMSTTTYYISGSYGSWWVPFLGDCYHRIFQMKWVFSSTRLQCSVITIIVRCDHSRALHA